MTYLKFLAFFLFSILASSAFAQKIVYSEPERDDSRRMNFDIIGKISGNFLVYKNIRNSNYVVLFDNNMQQTNKQLLDYMPSDRLINVDFFAYADFFYAIYEYQKKNVVYCDAVKIDGSGKKIADVINLDTTHIGFGANNKIYSAISSENKSNLMVFKINSRNRNRYIMTTLLFDDQLALKKRSRLEVPMEETKDYLDQFNLDNEGGLVFAKYNRNSNETINNIALYWKKPLVDSLQIIEIPQEKMLLDEPEIKIDNVNRRYFLTSFYYRQKRGNVEGLFFYVLDKQTGQPVMQNTLELGEALRKEAKGGDANIKTAFNDYFIRNIIIKKDGGFIINTESYYTTSRYNSWNRWNYMYGMPITSYDYYSYSPLYSNWYWRNRYDNGQAVRYHADNVTIMSFDKDGKLQWNNVLHKEQFDDESDDRISFEMINTGGLIHYIFNLDEKRTLLLNDFTLAPDGQMNHNPTLKNLDRGYEFMPKYGKQVSSHQVIIPCFYRNYICFAKLDFNL